MSSFPILRFLHLFLAFSWVAAVLGGHFAARAARRAASWPERAALWSLVRRLGLTLGLGPLLLLGVLGNVLAMSAGARMATTPALRYANGLWVVVVLITLLIELPAAGRLAATAGKAASGAAETPEWNAAIGRWRLANMLELLLFVALLIVMLMPWTQARG